MPPKVCPCFSLPISPSCFHHRALCPHLSVSLSPSRLLSLSLSWGGGFMALQWLGYDSSCKARVMSIEVCMCAQRVCRNNRVCVGVCDPQSPVNMRTRALMPLGRLPLKCPPKHQPPLRPPLREMRPRNLPPSPLLKSQTWTRRSWVLCLITGRWPIPRRARFTS